MRKARSRVDPDGSFIFPSTTKNGSTFLWMSRGGHAVVVLPPPLRNLQGCRELFRKPAFPQCLWKQHNKLCFPTCREKSRHFCARATDSFQGRFQAPEFISTASSWQPIFIYYLIEMFQNVMVGMSIGSPGMKKVCGASTYKEGPLPVRTSEKNGIKRTKQKGEKPPLHLHNPPQKDT